LAIARSLIAPEMKKGRAFRDAAISLLKLDV